VHLKALANMGRIMEFDIVELKMEVIGKTIFFILKSNIPLSKADDHYPRSKGEFQSPTTL